MDGVSLCTNTVIKYTFYLIEEGAPRGKRVWAQESHLRGPHTLDSELALGRHVALGLTLPLPHDGISVADGYSYSLPCARLKSLHALGPESGKISSSAQRASDVPRITPRPGEDAKLPPRWAPGEQWWHTRPAVVPVSLEHACPGRGALSAQQEGGGTFHEGPAG